MKKTMRVTVTGAAGQIGYALLFRLAAGEVFGKEVQIVLSLLELEQALPALTGVVMELEDGAFPCLKAVSMSSDPQKAFAGADWAFLIGSVPRKVGMERKDLLMVNGKVFVSQGQTLDAVADGACKVLVVGNPCNTNCYIAKSVVRRLNPANFYSLMMLDQKRAVAQLALKARVSVSEIQNVIVWGNHSATQYPDFLNATLSREPVIKRIPDRSWLENEFIESVQKRGAEIIKRRGVSSAGSAAEAIIATVRHLSGRVSPAEIFSVGTLSDGSYGVDEGLIFGFPVVMKGQDREIVQGQQFDDFSRKKVAMTLDELREERRLVHELIL